MTDASMLCAQTPRNPFLQDADFTLYVGDALEVLRELPDESVHCCVTSPPYWGLRDYGSDGQIGLEATPELFVAAMVSVFREVRRVLRADGTCWLNLGDSYASSPPGNVAGVGATSGLHGANDASGVYRETLKAGHATKRNTVVGGLKPKDLVGIPWRVAFALQADGWYLRSDIIWSKPNPMPESVTDRPTKAHEYVFLLTKSPRYYWDQEAVREEYTPDGRTKTWITGRENSIQPRNGDRWPGTGRNIRSVWEIATQPYAEAHFATFPEALPDRCIRAGTSERGCCPVCGAPWEREVERTLAVSRETARFNPDRKDAGRTQFIGNGAATLGWRSSCAHEQHPVPCTVLDPFMGSGTTALVARKLGRRSIGIELNEEYAALAARRLQQQSLFAGDAA